MNDVVVDTDVASYLLRRHALAPSFAAALHGSNVLLSFMTVAELRAGALMAGWGNRRCAELEDFIRNYQIIYPDNYMCSLWAEFRAESQASATR